ncbi:MAG: hypothetical protein H6822_11140 [Planctomycetaceae bacterium]|nr:hypothetical protein [Planctomycetales bacterium]MCB9922729.1 hypothetical protein [Planctomycetaceae bacterium]
MDDKQTRIAKIGRTAEREILDRIVNAMLSAEDQLCNASVQEWTRVLTDSCRMQKLTERSTLVTTC